MRGTRSGSGTLRMVGGFGLVLLLSQCSALDGPPVSAGPDRPSLSAGGDAGSFAVAGEIGDVDIDAAAIPGGTLGLPELIDLGQRSNPATRVAWQQAKQAAAAVGMLEATFLPVITANVVGGVQEVETPLRTLSGRTETLTTTSREIVPTLTLAWLLFDFGEREALRDAAGEVARAANVRFNGAHQALIYTITRAYYLHGAAQARMTIAQQARRNSLAVLEAAQERFGNGLGTSIEVAQARQMAAQAKFRLVTSEDGLSDAYQDLLGAVGVSPRAKLAIRTATSRRLPRARALAGDRLIRQALVQRPDVLAAYAAVRAGEANERAAEAAFAPKVYLGAVAAANQGQIQTGALPGLGVEGQGQGVFLGVTIPVYDGDIRKNRLRQARAATRAASATYEQLVNAASREIIVANTALKSALAAHEAATELRTAAQTSFDATLEAYRNGLGTLTAVSIAESGLLDARQAQADAHAAALVAAATLAFALGDMTSRDAPARALQ